MLSAVLASVLVTPACSSGPQQPTGAASPARVGTGCTLQFGVGKVKELFAAFNSGDEPTVRRLIFEPQPGKDGLEMTPSIRSALAKGVIDESTDIQVHSTTDLGAFMQDIAGLHFEVHEPLRGSAGTELQTGPGALTGPAVAVGPVLWTATGPPVTDHHHRGIEGGGKTLIDCLSGKFARALFSPLSFK